MLTRDYFQRASTICLYGLQQLEKKPYFPSATTVAFLRCSPQVIPSLLEANVFPRLQTVHYLSGHPGSTDIHRLRLLQWIFPNRAHPFYDRMVEAGYGRRDPNLIRQYISGSYQRIHMDTKTFDLHIPGYRIMDDLSYCRSLFGYMSKTGSNHHTEEWVRMTHMPNAFHMLTPQQRYLQEKIDDSYFDTILKEDEPYME